MASSVIESRAAAPSLSDQAPGDCCSPQPASGLILVVGDTSSEIARAVGALESVGPTTLASGPEALAALDQTDADLIVVDERVGGQSGCNFLQQTAAIRPSAVRVLLDGNHMPLGDRDSVATAVLPKPIDERALCALCRLALRYAATQRAARDLKEENDRLRGLETEPAACGPEELADVEVYEGILARSAPMRRVLRALRKIEGTDTTVLIYGESGTGKELVARAIHGRSRRSGGRFVMAELAGLSEPLQSSELFGHVRGAFSGAFQSRTGLFVEASSGCIFLDEVSGASPALQVALLRVLEEGSITPVGSDKPRQVDVRVIAGTNRNLPELVRMGLFRQDLYYRLSVFPLEIPPLRERPEDVFPLASHFLASASLAAGKKPPAISRQARAALEAQRWEGNVRELRSVIERAAILCKGDLLVTGDLPVTLGRERLDGSSSAGTLGITIPPGGATLRELEREVFLKTLVLTNGNQSRAARILGLRESTLRFRLRKLGIASRRVRHACSQYPASI